MNQRKLKAKIGDATVERKGEGPALCWSLSFFAGLKKYEILVKKNVQFYYTVRPYQDAVDDRILCRLGLTPDCRLMSRNEKNRL